MGVLKRRHASSIGNVDLQCTSSGSFHDEPSKEQLQCMIWVWKVSMLPKKAFKNLCTWLSVWLYCFSVHSFIANWCLIVKTPGQSCKSLLSSACLHSNFFQLLITYRLGILPPIFHMSKAKATKLFSSHSITWSSNSMRKEISTIGGYISTKRVKSLTHCHTNSGGVRASERGMQGALLSASFHFYNTEVCLMSE